MTLLEAFERERDSWKTIATNRQAIIDRIKAEKLVAISNANYWRAVGGDSD